MSELVAIGGIQPLMKMLLDGGLLHGECLTVTGQTLQENLENVPMYMSGQDIVRPLVEPAEEGQPPRGAVRQPRARGGGGEDHRQGG